MASVKFLRLPLPVKPAGQLNVNKPLEHWRADGPLRQLQKIATARVDAASGTRWAAKAHVPAREFKRALQAEQNAGAVRTKNAEAYTEHLNAFAARPDVQAAVKDPSKMDAKAISGVVDHLLSHLGVGEQKRLYSSGDIEGLSSNEALVRIFR